MKLNNETISLLYLIGFLLVNIQGFAQAKSDSKGFQLPAYKNITLPNGLTVYLMEQREVPLIYVTAVFPAGAVYDGPKGGLASLTADALLFGTKSQTKSQIEEALEFLGARINTFASEEAAYVKVSFAAIHTKQVLPLFKDVIVNPVFNQEDFEKRKAQALVRLDQAKESPRAVINNYFKKFIYGDHSYGNAVSGSKSSVEQLEVSDVKAFYAAHYVPNGAAIAIAGDFKAADMEKQLKSLFKDWKKGEVNAASLASEETKPLQKSRILLVNKEDATETTFLIGQKGISRNNPDYVSLQVINTILGGRFTSWLNDELRVNSGLTYGAGSSFNAMKNSGTFTISTFTKNESTTDAIDLALQVNKRLHDQGLDEETLTSAKNYINGQYPPRYETSGDLADLMASMFLYNFDASFINNFQKSVDELTVEKSKELITKYFPKDNLQFVLVGKATEIREAVKKYGDITEKEITAEGF